jgi:hypothetical protein
MLMAGAARLRLVIEDVKDEWDTLEEGAEAIWNAMAEAYEVGQVSDSLSALPSGSAPPSSEGSAIGSTGGPGASPFKLL